MRISVLILTLLMCLSAGAQKRSKGRTPVRKTATVVEVPAIDPKTQMMLDGMERVLIFDSLVVRKQDLLKAYPLMSSAGSLRWKDPEQHHEGTTHTCSYDDLRYASMTVDSCQYLTSSYRFGTQWTEPERVFSAQEGDSLPSLRQSFPFLLSDGVTLYFAQEDPEGLGGLDIYMTRRGGEDNQFFRPENIGMPFNSTANDYLMAIDEELGIGCFASDRRQGGDSVCVYYFIPNTQRETYPEDSLTIQQRQSLAAIDRIADTWSINPEQADNFRQKLAERRQALEQKPDTNSRSTQLKEMQRALTEMEESLQKMRQQWHNGQQSPRLRELILEMEERVVQKRAEYRQAQ